MKRGSTFRAFAFVLAALGMASSANSNHIPNNQYQVRSKDAIKQTPPSVRPVSIRNNFSGGDNPFKHYRKSFRSQPEYRNWMKQVPQMRRSKKCKLK